MKTRIKGTTKTIIVQEAVFSVTSITFLDLFLLPRIFLSVLKISPAVFRKNPSANLIFQQHGFVA